MIQRASSEARKATAAATSSAVGMPGTGLKFCIASRIAAGLGGSYLFTYGFCALGIVMLVRAGMGYEEAEKLVYLLAFLLFLGLFCWAFAAPRLGIAAALTWFVSGAS